MMFVGLARFMLLLVSIRAYCMVDIFTMHQTASYGLFEHIAS